MGSLGWIAAGTLALSVGCGAHPTKPKETRLVATMPPLTKPIAEGGMPGGSVFLTTGLPASHLGRLSPDGSLLAIGGAGALSIVDVANGAVRGRLQCEGDFAFDG